VIGVDALESDAGNLSVAGPGLQELRSAVLAIRR
jgi:hypothetical protein